MFRDVPGCSGMFRDVPCSGFYRLPAKIATFASRRQHTSTKERGRSAENKSSRHNSVTAAVSNVQTTSQALTEVENKRHF